MSGGGCGSVRLLLSTVLAYGRLRSDQSDIGKCNCKLGGSWFQIMVVLCYWGMQVQIARHREMVGSRWPEVQMPIGKCRERTDLNRKVKREKVKISRRIKESNKISVEK